MVAVARILGVPRQAWHRWVHGHVDPATGSVRAWLQQWISAGYPALEVRTHDDGFVATPVAVYDLVKPVEGYTLINAAEWEIPKGWGVSVVHEGQRYRYGEVEGIGWALCPEEE